MFDNVTAEPGFCTLCDCEALYIVPSAELDTEPLRLCYDHKLAFVMGQTSPSAAVEFIQAAPRDGEPETVILVCPACHAIHNQPVADYDARIQIFCVNRHDFIQMVS